MPSAIGVEWCTYKGHFPPSSGLLSAMAGSSYCTGALSLSNPIYCSWFGCILCCYGRFAVVESKFCLVVKYLMELYLARFTCWCCCCCQRSDRWASILLQTLTLFLACLCVTASLTNCCWWCRYMPCCLSGVVCLVDGNLLLLYHWLSALWMHAFFLQFF